MELSSNPMQEQTPRETVQEPKNFSLNAIKELSNYSFDYAVKVQ